jgi:hypothetical protein
MHQIPPEVEDNLGYYVYMYIDPRDDKPFYIGKGCGSRVLAHLSDENESEKKRHIDAILDSGNEPLLYIVQHGIENEETALRVETALIDCLKIDGLTNAMRGWGSEKYGLVSLSEHIHRTMAQPIKIKDSVIMLNLRQHFRYGMDDDELYETTRGVWRAVRHDNQFAFGVYKGVVQGVFEIDNWQPAGTAEYNLRSRDEVEFPNRWEFTGRKASTDIWNYYVGKSVKGYINNPQWSHLYPDMDSE